jgi:maltose O-acetyltransferase
MIEGKVVNRVLDRLRYDYPLHFIMMLTSWFPSSVTFYRIRGFLARPFFGSCGENFRINRNVTFYNASSIRIGKNVYVAMGCVFLAMGDIEIGDEVMFGPYVVVTAGKHTKADASYRFAPEERAPIKIGSGTWVGAHTTIAGGALIGSGCVIGCNAAVTRGIIPDNALAVGVPAVVKRIEKDFLSELPTYAI